MANPDNPESGIGKFIGRLFHLPKKPDNPPKTFEPTAQNSVNSIAEATLITEKELTTELVRKAVGNLELELQKPVDARNFNVVASSLVTIGIYFVAGKDKDRAVDLDEHYYSEWRRCRNEPSPLVGESLIIENFFQSILKLKTEPLSNAPTWYVPGGSGINRLSFGFSGDGSFKITNLDRCSLEPQQLHEVGIRCGPSCDDHQVWRPA